MALRTLAVLLALLALPASALAQGAGDEQYQDPFGDEQGQQQEPAPTATPAPAQPPPAAPPPAAPPPPAAAAAPSQATPAPAAAPPPATSAQQLPYTGAD